MINDTMTTALNDQVRREFQAAQNYLAMATHLDGKSLESLAAFFYRQADEEREHAMKLVQYLLDVGRSPSIPAIECPQADFCGAKEIVEASLAQEQSVTQAIHELVDEALTAKDHSTYQFLLWFVDEQVEEEATFGKLLDIIEMSENVLQVEHYVRHMNTAEAAEGEGGE
ncbi:MAG: ferritin [Acidobacteria bacterium]|nr:ferritin [Acidobacteriota bacterium]